MGVNFIMARIQTRSLALLTVLAILLMALGGCWNPFAPPDGDPGDPGDSETYRYRLTPEDVLHNLTTAYEYMNSEEYLLCLAEEFVFKTALTDQNDPNNPLPPEWGKQTERDIHLNMFADDSNVDRITLDLTDRNIEFVEGPFPDQTDDDTWRYTEEVDLRVYIPLPDDDLIYLATADNMFTFQVDADPGQVGPNGEPLWEIIEWEDLEDRAAGALRRDPNTEITSVGRIKSRYLE
jgi:hypothetical protein